MTSKLLDYRRFLLLLVVSAVLWWGAGSARAQEIVAQPDQRIFTVMAALNAAGYDAGVDRMAPDSLRAAVRKDLEARAIPSLDALREFYQAHRLADPARDLSQYVSLALLLGPPPKFELMLSPANLPPDGLALQDMVPLIAAFYEQADIPALWNKYLPTMAQDAERYQRLLARVIQQTNGYLRVDTAGYFGLRFAVYLNPLGAPGLTDARNYGDNYYIVTSASATLPEEQIRHAWLHYLLDSYALKYPHIIASKAELAKITQRAPALEPAFRSNFSLLLTESLIRAIQARLSGSDERTQLRMVQDSVEDGYLLTAYFFDAMKAFISQPVGMRLYFPELIDAISVDREKKRLAEFQFRVAPARRVEESRWSPLEQMLRQAQDYLAKSEFEQARQIYESLTQQYGPQAAVFYGLALVASQQKQPELAKQYFSRAAALAYDSRMKSWSHIYLGRLLDLEGNRAAAVTEYAEALAVDPISSDTRAAAEQGLEKQFARPGGDASSEPASQPPRPRLPLGKEVPPEGAREGQ